MNDARKKAKKIKKDALMGNLVSEAALWDIG